MTNVERFFYIGTPDYRPVIFPELDGTFTAALIKGDLGQGGPVYTLASECSTPHEAADYAVKAVFEAGVKLIAEQPEERVEFLADELAKTRGRVRDAVRLLEPGKRGPRVICWGAIANALEALEGERT